MRKASRATGSTAGAVSRRSRTSPGSPRGRREVRLRPELRAQAPRPAAAHPAPHAERARLVAGRHYDAAADGDRFALRLGSSRWATEAKNASASAWRIVAWPGTNIGCPHQGQPGRLAHLLPGKRHEP